MKFVKVNRVPASRENYVANKYNEMLYEFRNSGMEHAEVIFEQDENIQKLLSGLRFASRNFPEIKVSQRKKRVFLSRIAR